MLELWDRHMDSTRVLAVALGAVAYGLLVVALALTPGFAVSGGADSAWFAKVVPALAGASGLAIRGYAFHRRPGTRKGLCWGLAQGGLMFLVIFAMFALATAFNPIVRSNEMLGGAAWAGLSAIGVVLGLIANVLWERSQRRRRIAVVLLAASCLIIVGLIGLRAGGPWILIGTPSLLVGIVALIGVALQGAAELVEATGEPAT